MTEPLRQQLIDCALEMNRCGINQGTSGNLSIRCEDGMLITPSGVAYGRMKPEHIVFVDAAGGAEGSRKPSSEWRIHHDVYRSRPDAGAILHAHPTSCSALACLRRPIPAFHYMVAVAGGRDIRCAPYATFGSQALSDGALQAIEGRRACLLANHGLLCLAADLPAALVLAIEVEQLARAYLQCLSAGEPVILDDAEMERVVERFRGYGKG